MWYGGIFVSLGHYWPRALVLGLFFFFFLSLRPHVYQHLHLVDLQEEEPVTEPVASQEDDEGAEDNETKEDVKDEEEVKDDEEEQEESRDGQAKKDGADQEAEDAKDEAAEGAQEKEVRRKKNYTHAFPPPTPASSPHHDAQTYRTRT